MFTLQICRLPNSTPMEFEDVLSSHEAAEIIKRYNEFSHAYLCSCGFRILNSERESIDLMCFFYKHAAPPAPKDSYENVRGSRKGCRTQRKPISPGETFGLWTVIEVLPGRKTYLCRCQCGAEKPVQGGSLRLGAAGKPGGSAGCRSCATKQALARRKVTE